MSPTQPTIAAIATPPGRGGVGIVRVSGTNLQLLMAGIVGRGLPPRMATVATFRDGQGAPLDTGLALYFPAPNSYTGEDVLELQGHGGPAVLRLLLARCIELGAQLAAPGEFTRRAFLNGKLDLAQAESVADLIEAATATAARAAARSLTGEFSREVAALVDQLIDLRTYTEAMLDFPEEEIEFLRAGDVVARLVAIAARVARALDRARTGVRLREGLTIALVGQPNVGKSSLMNALAKDDVAIVAPVPGTTRDTVERGIELAGIPLTVIDTAGLRDTADAVEQLGIARTWAAVDRADLVLLLVDARAAAESISAADRAILARLPVTLPRVVIHNKNDLIAQPAVACSAMDDQGATRRHVWLSATTGEGLSLLEQEVLALAGVTAATESSFLARERHVQALRAAQQHLAAAAAHVAVNPPPIELFAEELREAQLALSSITGEFTADDLLGAIFGRFCIGK